jgi:PKD repeat protein
LLVEGLTGADGNVFDVAIGGGADGTQPVAGARLYSHLPTVQLPLDAKNLLELRLAVPAGAQRLHVENYDAAGATVRYTGRLRSEAIVSSERSRWRTQLVPTPEEDRGAAGSITMRAGAETPNDVTLFVAAEPAQGADAIDSVLPIELPARVFPAVERPRIEVRTTPLLCGNLRFDASATGSDDPAGVRHSWTFDGVEGAAQGAIVQKRFDQPGLRKGRVESFNASGMLGGGSALDFEFLVKEPPVARLTAPALVAETQGGTSIRLDATRSTAAALPQDNRITRYEWRMGDGATLVQREGDPDFGRPLHVYARPGVYTVEVTAVDDPENPCNRDSATATIRVNAAPIADTGGDRQAVPGEEVEFAAAEPAADQGDAHAFSWSFSDGETLQGRVVRRSFTTPGTYSARLTVDDGAGASNSVATNDIAIAVNAAPAVDLAVIPQGVTANEPVTFDARAALDPDGSVTGLRWRFGDGYETQAPVFSRSFATPGEVAGTLEVSDDSGLANATATRPFVVAVSPPENQPPVPLVNAKREGIVGETIEFYAYGSRDADGAILQYRWDFGDGGKAQGIRTRHAWREAGSYTVTLEVDDNSGQPNATARQEIGIVIARKPDAAPLVPEFPDRQAVVNEVLAFDASESRDGEGSVLSAQWDFGDGATASGLTATHAWREPGNYTVSLVVRDDSGREENAVRREFVVAVNHRENAAPAFELTRELDLQTGVPFVFDASAARDADGVITHHEWDFGDGTKSREIIAEHTYALPGTYEGSLTLRDDSGLPDGTRVLPFTARVIERVNVAPVAEAGADVQAIVGESVTLDGGGSSDSDGALVGFDWDFGNGKTASGERRSVIYTAPGEYLVTLKVTDDSGQANATAVDTLTVRVGDRPNVSPVARVEPDRPSAIDEPVPFSAAQSEDPDGNILSYEWDFGDGATANGREAVHAYSASGVYEARLTIRDDSGLANAEAQAVRVITVNQPPVAEAGPDQHVTASTVEFDATASTDSDGEIIDYAWDFGDGDSGNGPRIVHSYANPGDYVVSLTVTDSSGTIRNTHTDTMAVRVNALPVADAGFDQVAAPGEWLSFDGTRSEDPDGEIERFAWDFGDGAKSDEAQPQHAYEKPGTYRVELVVHDDSGHEAAQDFSQIRVFVNDRPTANAGPDLSVAPGETFTLFAGQSADRDGAITQWRWDISGSDTVLEGEKVDHSFAEPGIYTITLTVTDDSSASNRTAQDDVTVRVNHAPVAEAGKDLFSDQLRVELDAGASADPDGDGLTYKWNMGDGTILEGAQVEHTYASGGVYPVLLTVDDGRKLSNSSDTDAMTVRINRPPTAVAGDNRNACVGDVLVFDASASADPDNGLLRYGWDFGDGANSDLVNPTKIYEEPGDYRVRLSVTDESGLENATHVDEAKITILPAPVARAGPDIEACAGQEIQFDGSASTDIDGLVNRFSWDFGDGLTGGGDKPVHAYSQAGRYRVSLQIEGDNLGTCAPISSDDLEVLVREAPIARIQAPGMVALGEEAVFDGSRTSVNTGAISSWRWDFGDGASAEGATVRHAFTKAGQYKVRLVAGAGTETGGCQSAESVHLITVNDRPLAVAEGPSEAEVGQSLEFTGAPSSDPDGGIAAYRWDFGDGTTASGVTVRHVWRSAGAFQVKLTVDDGAGQANSTSDATIEVLVKEAPGLRIAAPERACAGEAVAFDLAGVAEIGPQTQIDWAFGDGTSAQGRAQNHIYAASGRYSVGVRAGLDRAGREIPTPRAWQISVNDPPRAVFVSRRKTCAGEEVEFDASRSFDTDGAIVSHEWDFGDGAKASGAVVRHKWEKPGSYEVTLSVRDDSRTSCAATVSRATVFVNSQPVAEAGADGPILIGGAADSLVLDASGSTDADGDPLEYRWELSDGTSLEGEKVRINILTEGELTATVTASDPHGLACSQSMDTRTVRATYRKQSILIDE